MEQRAGQLRSARHPELDIAKAIGICGMVLVHVFFNYYISYLDQPNELFRRTVLFLGRFPAAPLFMFCLGVGVALSRRNSPKALLSRGIRTFLIAYVLVNLVNELIPMLADALFRGTVPFGSFRALIQAIPAMLYVDVLQCAAMAFLFFAVVQYFALSDWLVLACGVVCSVLGMVLPRLISVQGTFFQAILGLLWGTYEDSYFPFFSWILFPCAGYCFCKRLLIPCENKGKMYGAMGLAGAAVYVVLSVLGLVLGISFGNFGELHLESGSYFHMNLYGSVTVLGFLMAWLWLCYLAAWVLPGWALALFQRLSKHITPVYVIHYVILSLLDQIILPESVPREVDILGLFVLVLFLSEVFASAYEWAKGRI